MMYDINIQSEADGSLPTRVTVTFDLPTASPKRTKSVVADQPQNVSFRPMVLQDRVAAEFIKHEKKWKHATEFISSPTEKYLHPSYARIIGLGPTAIPMILRSLQAGPDDWFYALRALTGVNPVTSAMAGNMREMSAAWLEWGRQRQLI